ncbi:MAG: DUF5331 domain-containing protein [Scytonema sp. PMC 1069.18]|nr:DUF5331 domain-containing protein [Scytonema sp. PMC 1069.18]MEC4883367.1 DUF5331 domain-containing protein [Scytonema sp. PMC 1070.18]
MNIQQIRQSLKLKWINYYSKNHSWLVKVRVWGTYDGVRRPSSGFILATVSALEPQLEQILPFIVELNSNPDEIVAALGLNFNIEEELYVLQETDSVVTNQISNEILQEAFTEEMALSPTVTATDVQQNTELLSEGTHEFLPLSDVHLNESPLPEYHNPINLSVDAPEQENQSIPSVAIATPTLESKNISAPIAFIGGDIESRSHSVSSVAVATVPIESKSQPVSLLALLSSEVESKSYPFRSGALSTQMDNKSQPASLAPLSTYEMDSKSRPLSMVAVIDSAVANRNTPHFSLVTDVENKDTWVTTLKKNLKAKLNFPPPKRIRHLADWVDEFCQGKKWSSEEDTIIP